VTGGLLYHGKGYTGLSRPDGTRRLTIGRRNFSISRRPRAAGLRLGPRFRGWPLLRTMPASHRQLVHSVPHPIPSHALVFRPTSLTTSERHAHRIRFWLLGEIRTGRQGVPTLTTGPVNHQRGCPGLPWDGTREPGNPCGCGRSSSSWCLIPVSSGLGSGAPSATERDNGVTCRPL
jgi:hypothetical protein